MKKKLIVTVIALFILTFSFAAAPKQANAVPAFAQKYHFSCAVCHTVFPNLNPFGRAFWRNGFRLPNTNGTPADATQITQGLSLPNPWPVPIMIEPAIQYQHYTNENVSSQTDGFSAGADIVAAGAFKLYTPFADSVSFYVHYGDSPLAQKQVVASINGIGSGFGIAPHLFNLKIGQVTTASPYFYRQAPFYLVGPGPAQNGQGLAVGNDGESGALIHARNAGLDIYGTPGYHLWYKVTVTNDAGASTVNANTNGASNAMEYSYQLREITPISAGQLEFGYYGATIAEPMGGAAGYTNRILVNGFDADLANNIYEVGATYITQSDSHPYGNPSVASTPITLRGAVVGNTGSSNGYSTFELYGRYLFPKLFLGNAVMLSVDYAQYSWNHKDLQEGFNGNAAACPANGNLYQSGVYNNSNGCTNEGIKDAFDVSVWFNLAYNAHLYLEYFATNKSQDNSFGTGLDFAF